MKNLSLIAGLLSLMACTKENTDLSKAISAENMPKQIVLDTDEFGAIEDEDKIEVVFALTDRFVPGEIGGQQVPLEKDAKINFAITEFEGFNQLDQYILGATAYYEIDDCTISSDQGLDLDLEYNTATGLGSFTFPAGVEEVVLEFETDPDLFDDDLINTEDRLVVLSITGLTTTENVVFNPAVTFTYLVLDDELAYGKYEAPEINQDLISAINTLFAGVQADVTGLNPADIDAFEMEIDFEDIQFLLILTATEEVEECGNTETVNIEIEIKGELDDLTNEAQQGDLVFLVEVENEDGSVEEFEYKGSFELTADGIILNLECEDLETGNVQLIFNK